jgi:hypothetical protein
VTSQLTLAADQLTLWGETEPIEEPLEQLIEEPFKEIVSEGQALLFERGAIDEHTSVGTYEVGEAIPTARIRKRPPTLTLSCDSLEVRSELAQLLGIPQGRGAAWSSPYPVEEELCLEVAA